MSDNNKTYRIKANVNKDTVLNVNLNQDFNIFEMLSLKIDTESMYKYHTSDYGCIAGRVLANGNFGIPNAKISIFIAIDNIDSEDEIISYLYPYKTVRSKNAKKIRYNLLPEEQLSECHRNVGTFPSKRKVLDDNNVIEIYDKYYKFTTRSNSAGDYMIFGIPTGEQTIHVDVDLSDIGILSQKPRDMIYKGYNITQFENANMFKKSENLDSLTQIITQNQTVNVYPFWGENSGSDIAITRRDIEISYDFTPTCVFMGSLITDEKSNGISKRCIPSERMGKMENLTTSRGTIEMIRKKQDGSVEQFIVQGDELIDGNGVWCYQIPMNLDYVCTDEYGNIVPTDDPTKGIPTRTRVRFRFSLTEFESDNQYSHLAKVLVPNNPKTIDGIDYVFGSDSLDNEEATESFRDLFWNNVYTVKSYIPRLQMINIDKNKRFSGIKAVNVNNGNNPIPYNNMRIDMTFNFTLQCAVFKVLLWLVGLLNKISDKLSSINCAGIGKKVENSIRCAYIGDGYCEQMDGWYFAPYCKKTKIMKNTVGYITGEDSSDSDTSKIDKESIEVENSDQSNICLTNNITYFVQCVELAFAMTYDVIQFDFYNDWMNGMIYLPRWFADIRPKRTYLFGAIKVKPRINACMDDNYNAWFARRYTQQCALTYSTDGINNKNYTKVVTSNGCKSNGKQVCHKASGRKYVKILKKTKPGGGVVHSQQTLKDQSVYYFRPCEWVNNGQMDVKCNLFATDIVLLGSLEESNSQGIPQSFKKLVSSTYQMPDALVSTNLGVEGFVYGAPGGSLCSGNKDSISEVGVERKPTTFKGVTEWTKGKEFEVGDADPYDEDEYPVTEVAGIDWGAFGPNQFGGLGLKEKDKKNSLNKLYFPGGHFLGISCTNSQTNIKSCINLSRMCEMGTMMSQRQAIIRKNDNGDYTYSYLVPTGLISGDDINDYGFKNEFATLNYNGLKTKRNRLTNLYEYEFETLNPINFNGELSKIISNASSYYNSVSGFNDNEEKRGNNDAYAYRRTIEENSNDYYKFRFNLHGDYNAKEKYLIVKGNEVSLPMYENSYYFYFGIKNGNTALDRFYEEFFAECPSFKDYRSNVKASSVPVPICEAGNVGIINLGVYRIENAMYRILLNGSVIYDYRHIPEGETSVEITGLTPDKVYTVEVSGDNIETITKNVAITYDSSVFSGVSYSFEDYTEEHDDLLTGSTQEGFGHFNATIDSTEESKLSVSLMSDIIGADGKQIETTVSPSSPYWIDDGVSLWGGNHDYIVYAHYNCGRNLVRTIEIGRFHASMPVQLDIVFNGNNQTSFKRIINPVLKEYENDANKLKIICERWFDFAASSDFGRTIDRGISDSFRRIIGNNDSIRYNLLKALEYQNAVAKLNGDGEINYEISFGKPPYSISLIGYGERGDYSSEVPVIDFKIFDSQSSAAMEGFDLATNGFISPTKDVPSKTSNEYYAEYIKNSEKGNYEINVSDIESRIPFMEGYNITLPSIYRPFFFRALFIGEYNRNQSLRIAIANGVLNDKSVVMECRGIDGNTILRRNDADYDSSVAISSTPERSYPTIVGNIDIINLISEEVYFVKITESGDTPLTISERKSVEFMGDSYLAYDSAVKYYVLNPRDENRLREASPYNKATNKIDYDNDGDTNYIIWNPKSMKKYKNSWYELTENDLLGYVREDGVYVRPNYAAINQAYVVGIYDSEAENNYNAARHLNTISVIKYYKRADFLYLMKEFDDSEQ